MSEKYLQRDDAPISEKLWQQIDQCVITAAKSNLGARKLITIQGPFGLGVKAIPSCDQKISQKIHDDLNLSYACCTPLVLIQSTFKLSIRDVAAYEQYGTPLDLYSAAKASMHIAQQEDNLIFNGADEIKIKGLLNTDSCLSMNLKSWDNIGAAAEDIMWAASMLENEGCHGPYTLGLSPNLFYMLFRKYPQSDTEFKHISQFVTDGIIKIPSITAGGVLICGCAPCVSILLGQDISTGFVGPSDSEYEFFISESVALRLAQPKAVCVLR